MSSDPERPPPNAPDEEPTPELTPGEAMAINAVVVYLVLGGLGVGGSWLILDRAPLTAPDAEPLSMPIKVALGAGLGLAVYGLDQVLERFTTLFRRMSEAFYDLLGNLTTGQALLLALFSSVGEEIFFRGFLQSWLGIVVASVVFGLLHIAPDKRLWPWPVMAVAMGFAFGWLFQYTGDVLAPMLAHFTINFFSLMALSRRSQGGNPEEA